MKRVIIIALLLVAATAQALTIDQKQWLLMAATRTQPKPAVSTLPDNLALWVTFTNAADPGHDYSGNGLDGTLFNGVATNGGIVLSATNAFMSFGSSGKANLIPSANGQSTLAFWFTPTNVAKSYGMIFDKWGAGAADAGFTLCFNDTTRKLLSAVRVATPQKQFASSNALVNGSTYFVVATISNTEYSIYINSTNYGGSFLFTNAISGSTTNAYDLRIGSRDRLHGYNAPMTMWELMFFTNRCLSQSEITTLYNKGPQ